MLNPKESLIVGDTEMDIQCGQNAKQKLVQLLMVIELRNPF